MTRRRLLHKDVILSREGVYNYAGQPVFKPFSEFEKAVKKGIPEHALTFEHPSFTLEDVMRSGLTPIEFVKRNFPTFGRVYDFYTDPLDRTLRGRVEIDEDKLVAAGLLDVARKIRAGAFKPVSTGYFYDYQDGLKGEHEGREYYAVQRNYEFNHTALTEAPRVPQASLGVGFDSAKPNRFYTIDGVRLGLDPMHPSWRSMYNAMVKFYGAKRGRKVFFATMNDHGWDETKPRPRNLKSVKLKRRKR